jgi:hypothetical protein
VTLNAAQFLLRNGKTHFDRRNLGNFHQAAIVVGLDLGAFIHQQAAGAAAEGGPDVAKTELQARILDRRLVARQLCFENRRTGAKLFEFVFADKIFCDEIGIAPGI